jgi:hypothetical protein
MLDEVKATDPDVQVLVISAAKAGDEPNEAANSSAHTPRIAKTKASLRLRMGTVSVKVRNAASGIFEFCAPHAGMNLSISKLRAMELFPARQIGHFLSQKGGPEACINLGWSRGPNDRL